MSYEDVKRSACDGKQALLREVAKTVAKRHKGLSYYKCRFCGNWHVGSSIKPTRSERKWPKPPLP